MVKISHTKIKQPSFGEKRPKLTYTKISRFTVHHLHVTRYPEAVALSTIYTETTMLGYPDEILSDQDLNFTSQLMIKDAW
jgi:hypothetical protein